jgi:hypothetical protein
MVTCAQETVIFFEVNCLGREPPFGMFNTRGQGEEEGRETVSGGDRGRRREGSVRRRQGGDSRYREHRRKMALGGAEKYGDKCICMCSVCISASGLISKCRFTYLLLGACVGQDGREGQHIHIYIIHTHIHVHIHIL